MSSTKKDKDTLYTLGLIALLLYLNKRKGFGTTLFGVGTKLDLSKPIEDIDAFIKAAEEEQGKGHTSKLFYPKGIYYNLKAGDKIWVKPKVTDNFGCSKETIDKAEEWSSYIVQSDQQIYQPTLIYLEEDGQKFLPPYITFNAPGSTVVRVDGEDCGYWMEEQRVTADRADYSRFEKR